MTVSTVCPTSAVESTGHWTTPPIDELVNPEARGAPTNHSGEAVTRDKGSESELLCRCCSVVLCQQFVDSAAYQPTNPFAHP